MALLILLIITEIFTIVVIRQHFYDRSWMRYFFFMIFNTVLSIWLWILWFKASSFEGIFDDPSHIWVLSSLAGTVCAVILPRVITIAFHFSGVAANRKKGGHKRSLTNAGMIISLIVFLIITSGSLIGRFNFKTDRINVEIKGLKPELEGFKIVQISDLHLASFYHHKEMMWKIIKRINDENPDIVINTGDFVTFGWREAGRYDTIISATKSKYGNFAVMGNHDFGTYDPFFTEADKDNNVLLMHNFIRSSGYELLNGETKFVTAGNSKIGIAGVNTKGSFPNIIHGDIKTATKGIESADLKILLAHDPNQWDEDVVGKTSIDLTFSGHTHGMQIGIFTKKFKWSPAKYFYKRWNGLYKEGNQYIYVNRGLGVLGVPFRIWMPPEITVLTLKGN